MAIACNFPSESELNSPVGETYFDLSDYFESEMVRLETLPIRYQKRILLNEQEEEVISDTLDLNVEFAAFINNDINKPSLIGRYQVDSVLNETSQLSSLVYRALDDKLTTRQIKIEYDSLETISAIHIESLSDAKFIGTNSKATYRPDYGYSIKNQQKIILFGAQDINIQVQWLK